jgi:hypothetical protein
MSDLVQIINTSRGRASRVKRFTNPVHGGGKQYIGGTFRIVRGRGLVLPKSEVEKHIPELKMRVEFGLLELRTMDGRPLDLNTLEPVYPVQPSPPLPKHVLGNVNDGIKLGQDMPNLPGGQPLMVSSLDPDVTQDVVDDMEGSEEEEHRDTPLADRNARMRKRHKRRS